MWRPGGVASLNFDAKKLKIFYGNLGSPSNLNLQYERFETYYWLYKFVQNLVLKYGVLWRVAHVLTESTISGPWRSNGIRPSPDFSPRLRVKIWEWPGDEANAPLRLEESMTTFGEYDSGRKNGSFDTVRGAQQVLGSLRLYQDWREETLASPKVPGAGGLSRA